MKVETLQPLFIYGHGSFKRNQIAELPNDVATYYINARRVKKIDEPEPVKEVENSKDKSKGENVYKPHYPTPPKASKTYVPAPRDISIALPQNNQPQAQEKPIDIGKVSKPEAEPNLPGENVYRDSGNPADN